MKIAYTGWTWLVNHEDNYQWEFEQFLKEVSELGYEEVENFAFITKYFDNDAEKVKGLLDRYGLRMVNLYEHFTNDSEADYESAVRYVDFMKKLGATHLNLQGVMWTDAPNTRPTDEKRISEYAELSNRIGKLCRENGCVACFHPHANTPVFMEEQIDLLMEKTDPELVTLCLDTAHTALAGMDVEAAFRKYGKRIGYVHLKDVDPNVNLDPAWPMNRFLPLGMGTLDFRGIYRALQDCGYNGTLCVELDKQPVCNYHSAMVSRQFLHNVLHL